MGMYCGSSAVSASEPSVPGRSKMEAFDDLGGLRIGIRRPPHLGDGLVFHDHTLNIEATNAVGSGCEYHHCGLRRTGIPRHCVAIRSNRLGCLWVSAFQ
jgi:hypothetical protein